jgi:hypothetical protein
MTKYLGTGPIYPQNGFEISECRTCWWKNVLYMNNFASLNNTVTYLFAKSYLAK